MTSWNLNIKNSKIWFSLERKELLKWIKFQLFDEVLIKYICLGTTSNIFSLMNVLMVSSVNRPCEYSCFPMGRCKKKVTPLYELKTRYTDFLDTTQKMKLSIKDLFRKCDQIHSFLRIWSNLLKKSLIENFIFCTMRNMREG